MRYDGRTIKAWAGGSQWRCWRADLARFRSHGYAGWASEGFWAITVYRAQRAVRTSRFRPFLWPVGLTLAGVRKLLTTVTHISLNPSAEIGPGLLIPHVGPIRVAAGAKIGADCAIHQVTTIGAGSKPGAPTIGDHVCLAAHVCVIGPVAVGDGARVGAGAVVVRDVPAGMTAVGVPARLAGETRAAADALAAAVRTGHTPVPDGSRPRNPSPRRAA